MTFDLYSLTFVGSLVISFLFPRSTSLGPILQVRWAWLLLQVGVVSEVGVS